MNQPNLSPDAIGQPTRISTILYVLNINEYHRHPRISTIYICERTNTGSVTADDPIRWLVFVLEPSTSNSVIGKGRNEDATRTDVPSIGSSQYNSSCTSSSRSFIPAASSTSTPKSKKPDLSTVLGPNGKLPPDERNDGRRMDYASFAHLEGIWVTNSLRERSKRKTRPPTQYLSPRKKKWPLKLCVLTPQTNCLLRWRAGH